MVLEAPYDGITDRPLFGETRYRDRVSFLIITILTTAFVVATFVCIFLYDHIKAIYIFLSLCVTFLLGSHLCLAFWYRSGDLEPRFRNMLYFNTCAIILLCIGSNIIISERYK